jgi:cell division protein FtsB
MRNIKLDWFAIALYVLIVFGAFVFGAGYGVMVERDKLAAVPVIVSVDTQVYDDLKELDKRDQLIAKRINEMNKQIEELYSRTEYLKSILEQVIDVLQGPASIPEHGGNQL